MKTLIANLAAAAAVGLQLWLSGCGASVGAGSQDAPRPADAPTRPVQFQTLPFPADETGQGAVAHPERVVSGQTIYHSFSPEETLMRSQGTQVSASSAIVTSAGAELEYVMYRVGTAGSEPVELKFTCLPAGDDLYLALANHETQRWEFMLLSSLSDSVMPLNESKWLSPAGKISFALLAFDGSVLELQNYKIKLHYGDPVVHQVTETSGYDSIALVTVEERPGIFFYDGAEDRLRFAVAKNARPSSADDWSFTTVAQDGFPGIQLSATIHEGRPFVCYVDFESGALHCAWSDGVPDADSDWQTALVEDGQLACRMPSLEIVDGQPAVSFFKSDATDADLDGIFGYHYYAYHEGNDLASGWSSYYLMAGAFLPTEGNLAVVAGRPAIAVVHGQSGQLKYLRADNAFPKSTGDWSSCNTGCTGLPGRVRLDDAGGVPVMLYPRPDKWVAYLYADTAEPVSAAEWHEWSQAGFVLGSGSNFDLLVTDGRPDIMTQFRTDFQDQNGDPLHNQFVHLRRLFEPTYDPVAGHYVYFEFQVASEVGPGASMTRLEGKPAVAYLDAAGSKLMFGRMIF